MTPPTQPTPQTYTIRLKRHKSTTILHADPLAPLHVLKSELLRALRIIHPSARLPDGLDIPSDAGDVLLARPRDMHDVEGGWVGLDTEAEARGKDEEGKGGRKGGKGERSGLGGRDCLKALGVREGGVLAFKFRSEVRLGKEEDEGLGMVVEEDEDWDVVVPRYEDVAGVVNLGDVGGKRHFDG